MMEYQIERLAWDTAFFGRKIGKITSEQLDDATRDAIMVAAKASGYQLVYVFSATLPTVSSVDAVVDERLTFSKSVLRIPSASDRDIVRVDDTSDEDFETLRKFAFSAGAYSRFRLDERFGGEAFQRLYTRWLTNSLNGEIADVVLAPVIDKRYVGLITGRVSDKRLSIGLISVADSQQGRGFGRRLVEALLWQCRSKEPITELEVVTQGANQQARTFYGHLDFEVKHRDYVYHLWVE